MKTFDEALDECLVYARMGGLNEQIIKDVAHDFQVDEKLLLKEFGYE